MYNNIGKKIKGIIEAVTKISITIWVIIGVFFVLGGIGSGEFAIAVMGIIIAPLMCLVSWLSGLMIYAFGEITDNIQAIRNKLAAEPQNEEEQQEPIMNGQPKEKMSWTCYSCGTENTTGYCIKCGTSKGWSVEKSQKKSTEE